MNPKRVSYDLINEEYYYMKHPTGLDIYIYPKKDYGSKYAIFGTNFGSINNKFKFKNNTSYTEVPDGIAHYLEHKLFAGKDCDAFELFSKTGASANAYTSFEKTAYLFSCTDNFEESLNILLDFVQSPYFTPENVEKERGIINQEIKMYQDSPDWKVYINLLNLLYKNHPVKIDIAGSVESVSRITPEILYECYNNFYNLNNMCLCIVGDVNYNKIFELVDTKLKYSNKIDVEKYFPEETLDISQEYISEKFDINSKIFNFGIKQFMNTGARISTRESVLCDILLYYLTSPSSDMYTELLEKELINFATFSSEHLEGPGYSSLIFSGESKDPKKTSEIIKNHIIKLRSSGLNSENFERSKKAVYGKSMNVFNNISDIANVLLEFAFSGKQFFEYIKILQDIKLEDINKYIIERVDPEYSALSVAEPK